MTRRPSGRSLEILFLNHNVAGGGGTYLRALDVARELVRRGHRVTLLTIAPRNRVRFDMERLDGVTVVKSPDLLFGSGRTGWDPYDAARRVSWLRGRRWDIIHAWDCRPVVILPALAATRWSRPTGGRLVIDWCDWWGRGGTIQERSSWLVRTLFGPVETYFEEAFRTRADGTTVISRPLAERAVRLRVPGSSIQILPQGCDVGAVIPRDRARARAALGIDHDLPLVGMVGTINRTDAALLFDTLRLLFARDSTIRMVMIGNHRARIPADLRMSGRLQETGFLEQTRLELYLAACDAMLAPLADTLASRARWPSKVNLYLAAGKATVMTRVGDLAELLEETGAGHVVEATPRALAEETLLLLRDPALRHATTTRARSLAENQLAWPKIIDRLEALYLDLLACLPGAYDGRKPSIGSA